MAYVQRYVPKGQDLVTLDYFMNNRLSQIMEPAQAQLVAQQVYDLAVVGGMKPGTMTSGALDAIFNQMAQGRMVPLGNPYNKSAPTGQQPVSPLSFDNGTGAYQGDLLPRTGMQSPIETMRPARYFSTADAVTDSAGAFTYRLIDSLSLGLLGAAGGILKRTGVTEKNFWTESVGGRESLFGLDFGQGGIKGGDTTAGEWAARAGEFAGFALPFLVSGGISALARIPASQAGRLAAAKYAAEQAGEKVLADKLGQQVVKKTAQSMAIRKAGAKTVDVINKMPANIIFEKGGKAVQRLMFGEATRGVQSKVLRDAVDAATGTVFGVAASGIVGKTVTKDTLESVLLGSAKEAVEQGVGAGVHAGGLLSPKALNAAKDAVEGGLYEAPEVISAAKGTFRTRFVTDVQKKLGISYKGNEEFFNSMANNASKIFDDAFKEARHSGGLMNLHERVFMKGTGAFGVAAAKAMQNSASHITNMMLLGAVTRVTHPLAEPTAYGIDEDDSWQATKDIAKYWVRGAKWSPFEGVAGDIFVGSMFSIAGGANLIPMFQKTRSKNPKEMLSRMFGGTEDEWSVMLDSLDAELSSIYGMVKKGQDPSNKRGVVKWIQDHMRRNHADFTDLFENNPDGFEHIATKYLDFMEANKAMIGGGPPFTKLDIISAMKAHASRPYLKTANAEDIAVYESAKKKIIDTLFSHRRNWLNEYNRSNKADLLRDVMRFGVITTATSLASAPELWKNALKGEGEVHPADLVMHTMFSAMMARHPYYMDGASIYMPALNKGRYYTKDEERQFNAMRLRNAMRLLGVRDSSLVLDGQQMKPPMVSSAENPLAVDDRVNAAIKEANDYAAAHPNAPLEFAMNADHNSVKPGDDTVIHPEESQLLMSHIELRHRSGAEIDSDFLEADAAGKPTVFSGTFKDLGKAAKFAQVVGYLKRRLVADGILEKGEMLDPSKIVASEKEYLTQKVAQLSKALAGEDQDGAGGIVGRMNELIEPVDGKIRHIELQIDKKADGTPEDEAEINNATSVVEAYNELVDIAALLRKAVHIDENGKPLPEVVNLKSEKLPHLQALTEEASRAVAEMLGLKRAVLGRDGKLRSFLIESIFGAKVHQNTVFSVDGGTLFGSDGSQVSLEGTVKRAMVENGLGFLEQRPDGSTELILWGADFRSLEGTAGAGRPMKSEVARNLYNWLRATKGVRVLPITPGGKIAAPENLAKLFTADGIFHDSRGTRIVGREGGLDAILRDVGIVLDNSALTKHIVNEIRARRGRKVTREIREIERLTELAGMIVKGRYGSENAAVPVLTDSSDPQGAVRDMIEQTPNTDEARQRAIAIMESLPEEYARGIEMLGSKGMKVALTPEEHAFWRASMQKLIDSGELDGFASREVSDGTISDGTVVAFGSEKNVLLAQLKAEIQRQMNRSTDEVMKDISKGLDILERRRAELEGMSSLTKVQKRRLHVTKGLISLFKRAQAGGWDYINIDKAMIESGLVTVGKGKKQWKKNFGSLKDVKKLHESIKKFYQEERKQQFEIDYQTMTAMARAEANAEIARYLSGGKKQRLGFSEFIVATGLNMNESTYGEALKAMEDVRTGLANRSLAPQEAGAYLRRQFFNILATRLGPSGKGVNRYTEDFRVALGSVDDNYLLAMVTEMDQVQISEITRERGTAFPLGAEIPGTGPGDSRLSTTRISGPDEGTGSATSDYRSRSVGVSRTSRDLILAEYGRLAFFNPDGMDLSAPEAADNFAKHLFINGIRARRHEGPVGVEEMRGVVLMKDMSENENYTVMFAPTNTLDAITMADRLEVMVRQYTNRMIAGSRDLSDQIERIRFAIHHLRLAAAMGDNAVKAFSMGGQLPYDQASLTPAFLADPANAGIARYVAFNDALGDRYTFWRDTFRMARLDAYFGHQAVSEAFTKAASDPRAIADLMARAKLSNTRDDARITREQFLSSVRMLESGSSNSGMRMVIPGHRGTITSYLGSKAGLVSRRMPGTRRVAPHMTFHVYDSSEAKGRRGPRIPDNTIDVTTGQVMTKEKREAINRTMENMDGGIILNTHLLKILWHATGHDIFNPDTTFGLAKARFFYIDGNGMIATKDVMSADQGLMDYMEANNLSGIMSTEAVKLFTGHWGDQVNNAIIDYGNGDRDFFGRVTSSDPAIRATAFNGNANRNHVLELPLSSLVWQHPVDGNPDHATRSPQITGFRSERFIKSITDIVDANATRAVSTFAKLLGGTDAMSRLRQHYFFLHGAKQGLNQSSVNGRYMEFGGALTSGMDFGGSKHYMNTIKTRILDDHLFKIQTDNGTQDVYTVDTRESLGSSMTVDSHKSGLKNTNINTGYIAFDIGDSDKAQVLTGEIHGYGDRDNFYNQQPDGASQNFPTSLVHVKITGNGKYDGIYLGLLQLAKIKPGDSSVPVFRARHANGHQDSHSSGATVIASIMKYAANRGRMIVNGKAVAGDAVVDHVATRINAAWQEAIRNTGAPADVRVAVAKALGKLEIGLNAAGLENRIIDELMNSREAMYVDQTTRSAVIDKGNVQRYRLHNALSYMFGTYDYYQTSRSMTRNKGNLVTFGLSKIAQRHPSTMVNDTFAMAQLGFLDVRDGSQTKGYWKDMEDIAKADQDEDHVHSWYDYSPDEIGEALRLRMLSGGFGDPKADEMPHINYFQIGGSEDRPSGIPPTMDYDELMSRRKRAARAGIGIISKSIAAGSGMLQKGVAFEMKVGNQIILVAPTQGVDENSGQLHPPTDKRGRSILDRTQTNMQRTFAGIAEVHNKFTDAKTGVNVDPREMDLQGFVLSKFYSIYAKVVDKDGNTVYRRMHKSILDHEDALIALKAAASTMYRVSSFGKEIFTADGRRGMNIDEIDTMSQRYNTIWGKEADTAQKLEHIIAVGLSGEFINFGNGRKARAQSSFANKKWDEILGSIRVVTPSTMLKSRTVYDAMSEGVVKAIDSIYSGDRKAYLTEEERVGRVFGQEAIRMVAPDYTTAEVATFVANFDGTANAARELTRRYRDGEELLGYEAYMATQLHRQGIRYMQKTEMEGAFDRSRRVRPTSPIERLYATNNTIDALAVHIARAVHKSFDTEPERADERLAAAYQVIKNWEGRIRKTYEKEHDQMPEKFVDLDIVDAETRKEIENYLSIYGGNDNMIAAALDLLTPVPNGHWTSFNNVEMPSYKKFRHAFFQIIQQKMFNGVLDGSDYSKISPDLRQYTGENMMELLARARATASAIVSADPAALAGAHDLIEAISVEGRTVTSAIQFKNLKSGHRRRKMRENMFNAQLSAEFNQVLSNIQDAGFATNPSARKFGFFTRRDAERYLRDLQTDTPVNKRARINAQVKRQGISQIRSELLDENVDTAITAISIADQHSTVAGDLERVIHRGEWENVRSDMKKRARAEGKKDESTYEQKALMVQRREQSLVHLMLRSLDATNENRMLTMPRDISSRGDIVSIQEELWLKHGTVCP